MNKSDVLAGFVFKKLAELNADCPQSKAALAILRRGVGKAIADSPDTWAYVLADMPEEIAGRYYNGNVTVSECENAAYTALTLYAMHRQGNTGAVNNDTEFGKSLGAMRRASPNQDGIVRRFNSLISSSDFSEMSYHLRGIIQLMSSSSPVVGFDYCGLAKDLYFYQFPEHSKDVMLSWGREFYKEYKTASKKDIESE
jgi:CRISPR system Cascade subunit CasB